VFFTIYSVVDSDKPHSFFFEQYFGIKAYFEVISAKPAHIFYYHSRYFVFFYCFYHLLKSLSIKGRSAYSIIGIVIDIYKTVFLFA